MPKGLLFSHNLVFDASLTNHSYGHKNSVFAKDNNCRSLYNPFAKHPVGVSGNKRFVTDLLCEKKRHLTPPLEMLVGMFGKNYV